MAIRNDIRTVLGDTYNYITDILTNPLILTLVVITAVGYMLVSIVLFTTTSTPSASYMSSPNISPNNTIFHTMWVAILAIILFMFLRNIGFFGKLKSAVKDAPRIKAIEDAPVPEILTQKQVFNIPGNTYGYGDAKALCTAYGARLASYGEIENAYENGAEWCNYGWSDGQMALYPTQQKTFDKLQDVEGHEHDCGRPGINGGYMENSKLKFGVNCYGYKPRMTEEEEFNMATIPHYPQTKKDIAMKERVEYWKSKLSSVIVAPFNYNNWSKIY